MTQGTPPRKARRRRAGNARRLTTMMVRRNQDSKSHNLINAITTSITANCSTTDPELERSEELAVSGPSPSIATASGWKSTAQSRQSASGMLDGPGRPTMVEEGLERLPPPPSPPPPSPPPPRRVGQACLPYSRPERPRRQGKHRAGRTSDGRCRGRCEPAAMHGRNTGRWRSRRPVIVRTGVTTGATQISVGKLTQAADDNVHRRTACLPQSMSTAVAP
jgi:hypothetical protein